jgi:hypothetical protein
MLVAAAGVDLIRLLVVQEQQVPAVVVLVVLVVQLVVRLLLTLEAGAEAVLLVRMHLIQVELVVMVVLV